eukprot:1158924-Pelagomonas_calceolata.AAC.11
MKTATRVKYAAEVTWIAACAMNGGKSRMQRRAMPNLFFPVDVLTVVLRMLSRSGCAPRLGAPRSKQQTQGRSCPRTPALKDTSSEGDVYKHQHFSNSAAHTLQFPRSCLIRAEA